MTSCTHYTTVYNLQQVMQSRNWDTRLEVDDPNWRADLLCWKGASVLNIEAVVGSSYHGTEARHYNRLCTGVWPFWFFTGEIPRRMQAIPGFFDVTRLSEFTKILSGYVPPLLPDTYSWPEKRGKYQLHTCAICHQPRNKTLHCWRCKAKRCQFDSTTSSVVNDVVREPLPSVFARMLIWRKRFKREGYFAGIAEAREKMATALKG